MPASVFPRRRSAVWHGWGEAPWLGLGPGRLRRARLLLGPLTAEWEAPGPGPGPNLHSVVVAPCLDDLFSFFESVSVFIAEA